VANTTAPLYFSLTIPFEVYEAAYLERKSGSPSHTNINQCSFSQKRNTRILRQNAAFSSS
jgi:regulatory protein YycH of two-component signal transduction system YycFG